MKDELDARFRILENSGIINLKELVDALKTKAKDVGLRNSRQLFVAAQNKGWRERFAQGTDIPLDVLDELIGLSDLSRIYGVGPIFARMIYDAPPIKK